MKRCALIITVLIVLAVLAGCASTVRYTADEIKGYPPKVQDFIMKGEVSLGMTQQQARYAWGSPDHSYMLTPINGKPREEWVYNTYLGIKSKRLVFEDGKLAHILQQ